MASSPDDVNEIRAKKIATFTNINARLPLLEKEVKKSGPLSGATAVAQLETLRSLKEALNGVSGGQPNVHTNPINEKLLEIQSQLIAKFQSDTVKRVSEISSSDLSSEKKVTELKACEQEIEQVKGALSNSGIGVKGEHFGEKENKKAQDQLDKMSHDVFSATNTIESQKEKLDGTIEANADFSFRFKLVEATFASISRPTRLGETQERRQMEREKDIGYCQGDIKALKEWVSKTPGITENNKRELSRLESNLSLLASDQNAPSNLRTVSPQGLKGGFFNDKKDKRDDKGPNVDPHNQGPGQRK